MRVHLYFFWSETCPHCLEAHPFVEAIPVERPWVKLHALEVSRSRDNVRRFEAMAESVGERVEGVPTLFFCGRMRFAFMAAWLNVFQLLGALGGITLAAGLVAIFVGVINLKDFFAFEKGITLSIPEAAKPGIYWRARVILQSENLAAMLGATVFLAIVANFYELLCTAGFPTVYTRILTLTVASPGARYAWLALYNAIYIVPLLLIVLAFVGTLAAHKLSEREGRLLKLISGVMMFQLGLVLTFFPAWVNDLWVTAELRVGALASTGIARQLTREGAIDE